MSTESLRERIDRAAALIVKGKAVADRHRAEAAVHEAKGRHGKAADSRAKAAGQDSLVAKHDLEVRRLTAKMKGQSVREVYAAVAKERATAEVAARPRPDPLAVYTEAMMHVAEMQGEVEGLRKKAAGYDRQGDAKKRDLTLGRALKIEGYIPEWLDACQKECESSGRDLHREYALTQKAKERKDKRSEAENQRLERLGIETDDRTAAGQRIYRNPSASADFAPRITAYEPLITIVSERTPRRLDILRRFDTLCQTAEQGLFPELKFESESRSSGSPGPDIMLSRVGGLDELAEIGDVIGGTNLAMLRAWVFERQSNNQLIRLGYGSEKTISRLCLAALDALAVYWRTGDALRARMAGIQVAVQSPG